MIPHVRTDLRGILKKVSVLTLLATVGAILSTVAMVLVFFHAPIELTMGVVQKIFYVHVPAAMLMYAGFVICSSASLFYLLKPTQTWDTIAVVGVEIGLLFGVYVMVSGPLWGYKAWGKAWVFDPQLTTALILFLMYGGYALLRLFSGSSRRIRQIAAVFAVISSTMIPVVHWAVKVWGGIHPTVEREGGNGMHPDIALAFGLSMLGFLVLSIAVFWAQVSVKREAAKLESLFIDFEDYLKRKA